MLRRCDLNFIIVSLGVDAGLVWLAMVLAEQWRPALDWLPWSRPLDPGEPLPLVLYLGAPGLWVGVLALFALYDPRAIFKLADELRRLVLATGFAGLATAGLLYLSYREISRWMFLLFVGLAFGLLALWRIGARMVTGLTGQPTASLRRVAVVGDGPVARAVVQRLEAFAWTGLQFAGYITDQGAEAGGPVLGPLAEVRRMVQEEAIDEVVVTPEAGDRLRWLVGELLDLPVHVRVVPECFTLALDRPRIEDFAGVPMVDLRAGPLSDTQRLVKRLLDLALGSLLLVVALPVMGVIALAIKLDSPGPVLLRQPRVGENGRLFTMYKFRSMVQNAEALQALVTTRDAQGRLIHKRPDDPRVTRVGRFLRRTSLDELPQLFNVLKGEMSLVGPRPELPWIVAQYEPWQRRRLVVPQGLTGWWQVNGRGEKLMHLHTDADLYYITHYSLWLDLRILWKTVWVVLQGKGAY